MDLSNRQAEEAVRPRRRHRRIHAKPCVATVVRCRLAPRPKHLRNLEARVRLRLHTVISEAADALCSRRHDIQRQALGTSVDRSARCPRFQVEDRLSTLLLDSSVHPVGESTNVT